MILPFASGRTPDEKLDAMLNTLLYEFWPLIVAAPPGGMVGVKSGPKLLGGDPGFTMEANVLGIVLPSGLSYRTRPAYANMPPSLPSGFPPDCSTHRRSEIWLPTWTFPKSVEK